MERDGALGVGGQVVKPADQTAAQPAGTQPAAGGAKPSAQFNPLQGLQK